MTGTLIVLEGPDGAGKTSLADALLHRYQTAGTNARIVWFPGREVGSLGEVVYRLHHANPELGVRSITPAAVQALHIAAHLDAIQAVIKPFLRNGGTVILDRSWWSTWVYGVVSGVNEAILANLVAAEKAAWGGDLPAHVILLDRESPLRAEEASKWSRLRQAYHQLANSENGTYPIHVVGNDGPQEKALEAVWGIINTQTGSVA
ncbi:MAG: dTMP kinase [Kiritimatiellia bacterium]